MFVEAVIIVTTMTLFLMAIMFMRDLSVRNLRTQSLARASTIAYAMGGCTSENPTAWAGPDLGDNAPSAGTDQERAEKESSTAITGEGSERAAGIMSQLPEAGSDDSFMNPVGRIALATEASVTKRDRALGPRRGFTRAVTARSHASCGDEVREGSFGEMVDVVTSYFSKEL